jgi:opacity protein-like surface antigen
MTYLRSISPSAHKKRRWFSIFALSFVVALASGEARAGVGVQLGPQAGITLTNDVDPYVGFGLRLSAPSSPLMLQPTFHYVFDENQTLYHVGGNLLYELPIAFRLKPYLGVGAAFSSFALNQESTDGDGQGNRLGMSLLAGARLELPWVSPFLQITQRVGELDAFAVGGGIELTVRERKGAPFSPEPLRFAVTPYLANNVVGDVQSGRLGLGISLNYFPWAHLGFEVDGELHGHFFRDEDVAHLVPEGIDLNTNAALLSGSAVARYCLRKPAYGTFCPYGTAGFGAIHAWFESISHLAGTASTTTTQTDPALTAGAGVSHLFTEHVGVRVDARYFHALVAERTQSGYAEDYGFLRLSAGVSVGFN